MKAREQSRPVPILRQYVFRKWEKYLRLWLKFRSETVTDVFVKESRGLSSPDGVDNGNFADRVIDLGKCKVFRWVKRN